MAERPSDAPPSRHRSRVLVAAARQFQRNAQWGLDFIAAENSMGFHAPQEAARVLGEAIDYARQGQIAAITTTGAAPAREPAPAASPTPAH